MTSVRLPTGSSTSEATSTCMPLFFSSDVCAALPACAISTRYQPNRRQISGWLTPMAWMRPGGIVT